MAFPPEDTSTDARTIYAKPFSKAATEQSVLSLFGIYGSIRRIKLRREAATNSFRGSVYIEFADAASAHAAVNSPPRQPHGTQLASGSSQRFHVMMKTDYERKRANASSSAGGRDGVSMGAGRDGNSAAHKRARHRSDGPTLSSQREPPPPPPPPPPLPPGEQHGVMPVSVPEQSYQQAQQWKQVVDEREAVVRALEESLRKEREDNQRLYHRLEEAQQRAQGAATRESAANQKVLAREVEIGALKGEIEMLRTQGTAQLERQSAAHKARMSELDASQQRLKDALLEKERTVQRFKDALLEKEREQRKAAGAGRENGISRRPGETATMGRDRGFKDGGFDL